MQGAHAALLLVTPSNHSVHGENKEIEVLGISDMFCSLWIENSHRTFKVHNWLPLITKECSGDNRKFEV